ncbi:hypothetical protein B0H13DRAFT_1493182, partial [Mycena leptocephala]
VISVSIEIHIWQQERATVPARILKQCGILAASWFAFSLSGSFLAVVYFLPMYFQAIKGVSAVKSGIDNLLMILSLLWEYYTPFMILASIFTAFSAGLLSTLTVNTSHAHRIGYQVTYGLALEGGIQQPINAVQRILEPQDVIMGSSFILFMQPL